MHGLNNPLNVNRLPNLNFLSRSFLRRGFPFGALVLVLACLGLPARAVLPPPAPDGGYPNGNTAEGTNALLSLTSGMNNTAVGQGALTKNTSAGSNTAVGFKALTNNITGANNTATGFQALFTNTSSFNTGVGFNALFSNTTGIDNTALGHQALFHNTTSNYNTGVGFSALFQNTTGTQNTALGVSALVSNIKGSFNTATGVNALYHNTTSNNTANGAYALFSNTVGINNTAVGVNALRNNTGDNSMGKSLGGENSALGKDALFSNQFGNNNTAVGFQALFNLVGLDIGEDGVDNSALGAQALFSNVNGNRNTAIGARALVGGPPTFAYPDENTAIGSDALSSDTDGDGNTAIGVRALASIKTGGENIAVGSGAGAAFIGSESGNIDIGNFGEQGESSTIRIGDDTNPIRTFIAGINGSPITGTSVVVDEFGRLGTVASSQRFKDDIEPMDKASEAILALKPVTFRYKTEVDPNGIPQFGLIAEQVEKVNPDLVIRDPKGEVYTVRYEAVNAMLLNEFLKEHRRMEEQRNYFEAKLAQQQKQIQALAAGLQKVSTQIELSQSTPQLVDNAR